VWFAPAINLNKSSASALPEGDAVGRASWHFRERAGADIVSANAGFWTKSAPFTQVDIGQGRGAPEVSRKKIAPLDSESKRIPAAVIDTNQVFARGLLSNSPTRDSRVVF
jgi:hypothetical protein